MSNVQQLEKPESIKLNGKAFFFIQDDEDGIGMTCMVSGSGEDLLELFANAFANTNPGLRRIVVEAAMYASESPVKEEIAENN